MFLRAFNFTSRVAAAIAAWMILAIMLLTVVLVVLRYGFSIGSIAMQEAVTYGHAFAFMLGAAYTLQMNEHVRVDIFYQNFNKTQKAWVDALGILVFLLPVALFLMYSGWQLFLQSWTIRESSSDAGGLAYVYILKAVIPVAMLLLVLQAIAEFCKAARTLVIKEDHQ